MIARQWRGNGAASALHTEASVSRKSPEVDALWEIREMIDPSTEQLVPLAQARIPGNPHTATRWRWALHGVRGVKLETIIIGGQRYTSDAAVAQFIAALNAPGSAPLPNSTSAETANAKLAARGA